MAGVMGQQTLQDRSLAPLKHARPKHSPESSGKRGSLRMSLAPNSVLLFGRANSCPAGRGKGPAVVQCSLNRRPQPQRVARSNKGQRGPESLWAGPIPSCAQGGLHMQMCLGNP